MPRSVEHNKKIGEALRKFYANCPDRSFLTGRPPLSAEERFWKQVDKRGKAECWNWIRKKGFGAEGLADDSYGQFRDDDGHMVYVHVFSYKLHRKRKIPEGKFVCHSCDNPACVNPKHLWLGTSLDNNRDMIQKGRARYLSGVNNPMFGRGLFGSANGNFGKRGAFWVTNGIENQLVQPEEALPIGFIRGRTVDWSKKNPKRGRLDAG
jgi:HNH endonuclease